jgi:hypothetical protein
VLILSTQLYYTKNFVFNFATNKTAVYMTIFTLKEKNLKLLFFLMIAMLSVLLPIKIKAQKIVFKDCHPENNMDSLKKLLVNNQTPADTDRLKNLIKLVTFIIYIGHLCGCSFYFVSYNEFYNYKYEDAWINQ